jgi:outer membrane protein OmpA-like peptidoglycan-associated protein
MARAQAVADHLVKSGIDPERLLVRGLGSSVPIADNSTAQGRGLNRRIEFELR